MDKQQQRQIAYAARNTQHDKDLLSATICQRFIEQPAYQVAQTVLWYVACRSEVRTLPALTSALTTNKRCVVPYCTIDQHGQRCLGLWLLQDIGELAPGMWGILEPSIEQRNKPERRITFEELDMIMVPGVGFDRAGRRLGNGAGYYDRLLSAVRADTVLAGVCYESQLLERIVTDTHDVSMDSVITESAVYRGRRQP